MKKRVLIGLLLFTFYSWAQNIRIVDSLNQNPIAYATIGFGDGLGTFANETGDFIFSKEQYSDIDTLHISSIGYYEKKIPISELSQRVFLNPERTVLEEVVLIQPKTGKFKTKKQKYTTHTDLFSSWLPTIESEVACYFTRRDDKPTQISKLHLPINAEAKYNSKGRGRFPTFFRVQFYENNKGLPADDPIYNSIIFKIEAKQDKVFELDISKHSIFIPKKGIYISLQVLGYSNRDGKLSKAKKYYEVTTKRGVKKISVSYRPLLPFTNKFLEKRTYVRRLFSSHKKWQIFDITYNKNSKLVKTGYTNYGMGAEFKVFQ